MQDGQDPQDVLVTQGSSRALAMDKPAPQNTLAAIHRVVTQRAVQGSANSLLLWGAINLGIWLLLGAEFRSTVLEVYQSKGGLGVLTLAYAGMALGLVLLAFGLWGRSRRTPSIIIINGVAMIFIGLWNIGFDYLANAVLQPYGYSISGGANPRWMILGAFQIIWGLRDFTRYGQLMREPDGTCGLTDIDETKAALTAMVKEKPDPAQGRIRGLVTQTGTLSYFHRNEESAGQLCADCAVFVSKSMQEWVNVPRVTAGTTRFDKSGQGKVQTASGNRDIKLEPTSLIAYKQWAGIQVTVNDIKQVVSKKQVSRALLEPLLRDSDPQVSDAAAAALDKLPAGSA